MPAHVGIQKILKDRGCANRTTAEMHGATDILTTDPIDIAALAGSRTNVIIL
jgi:hypothetical protein